MERINFDKNWVVKPGWFDLMKPDEGTKIDLPHDYMVSTDTKEDAMSGPAMGYYEGHFISYTKFFDTKADWVGKNVYLYFDGVMQNATVEINGSKVALQHYGYSPFWVEIGDYLNYGKPNRVTVIINNTMQPNSRWYTGEGIYRHVELCVAAPIHIAGDGIYAYTKSIETEPSGVTLAYLASEITVENKLNKNHLVEVEASLVKDSTGETVLTRKIKTFVKANATSIAKIPFTVENPLIWDIDTPNLYKVRATVNDLGEFYISEKPSAAIRESDTAEVLFGIRSLKVDVRHGLRVNGNGVKLKGGCIHHDNGIVGAASIYDLEYRKLKKMKELGYNAIRTAHNPPSKVLLEACDRIGMYVLDEAFDCWDIGKQPGDYNQFFENYWKEDMRSFILRDRNHPSIVIWSTGNEIPQRGGLYEGYNRAAELCAYVKELDSTRPVTNGLCSFWSGLDDETMTSNMKAFQAAIMGDEIEVQNAKLEADDTSWEERSEAFVGMLDIVGYNYLEDHYEIDNNLYPERVMLGTESYPMNIDNVWALVEKHPYVIGDFTWTSVDYIGEAGIGKSIFAEPGSEEENLSPFALMSHGSKYPWRTAHDADIDIIGDVNPQGMYKKIVWGSKDTAVYVTHPKNFGKKEIVSMWGWPDLEESWTYPEYEGKGISVTVYSSAKEVELYLNGELLDKKPAGKKNRFKAVFDIEYHAGTLEAVSVNAKGNEISKAVLSTTGKVCDMRIQKEENLGGHLDGDVVEIFSIELIDKDGNRVKNDDRLVKATIKGDATILGFGSGNPCTDENYQACQFTTYRGKALCIVRKNAADSKYAISVTD